MKKVLAVLLVVLMMVPFATVASAAGNTTTLTATVPEATYTLNIPADVVVPFGATETELEVPTVTESAGFALGKNLQVTLTFDPFSCPQTETVIPYRIYGNYSETITSGSSVTFKGTENGSVRPLDDSSFNHKWAILMSNRDWGKALAGEYTSTITFTAEVVVEP